MSEIKEKIDTLIATDYERELLLKIDDVIRVTKLKFLKNIKVGDTKKAGSVLLRYDRQLRELVLVKYPNSIIKKHISILKPLAIELHKYISDEMAKGTSFY